MLFPLFSIPFIPRYIVPRQVKFNADLAVINKCLDELIQTAKDTRQEEDYEALQNRDYANVRLRFLGGSDVRILRICRAMEMQATWSERADLLLPYLLT